MSEARGLGARKETGMLLLGASIALLAVLVLSPSVGPSASLSVAPSPSPHVALGPGGPVSTYGTIQGDPSVHYYPIHRASSSSGPVVTPDATVPCPSGQNPCSLSYNGGAVMHNPEVVLMYWEPSGFNFDGNDSYSVNPSDAQYMATTLGFFLNASKASWLSVAQQYTDGSGAPGTTVSVWGTIWDTNAFPCGLCNSVSNPLTNAQVTSEISKMYTAHGGPKGANVEYFVFTPLGIAQCTSKPGTAGNCDASSEVNYNDLGYCAFHSNLALGGTTTLWAMMPDGGDHLRFCSAWQDQVYPYGPNGDQYADWEISIDSHEFMESITDPVNGGGWTDSSTGAEIGDLCAWDFTPTAKYDDLPNLLQNARPYFTQPEWDQTNKDCYQPNTPAAPTLGALQIKAPSSVPTGGTAYLWVNDTVSSNPAGWGNISVDFPSNPATSTIQVLSSTFPTTPTIVSAGTQVAGCYSTCTVTTTYPYVLGQTSSWAAGTTYGMELAYTPTSSGAQSVYVKSSVGVPGSAFASLWQPQSNATTDQQHENVTAVSISFGGGGGGGLTVSAPAATPSASDDMGLPVSFSTTVTGGTGPYSYTWTTTPSTGLGCSPSTSSTLSCTPTAAGAYTVSVSVSDTGGHSGSANSPTYTVYPQPTDAVPTASASSVSVGSPLSFTTAAGLQGSGGDTFAWSSTPAAGLGCSASVTSMVSCTPTTAGSYTMTATITDSNRGSGSNTSAAVTVTGGAPTVSAPTASPSSVDVGQSVTFGTSASGGSGGYVYAWTPSSASLGCSASSAASVTCRPTAAGTFTIAVIATDSSGSSSTSATSAPFVVDLDPVVSVPTASPASVDVSQSVSFTATATTPGAAPDTFAWTATPATGLGCAASSSSSVSCTPTAAGSYTVTVSLTDTHGGTSSMTSAPYTVDAAPSMTAPTPSPASGQAGVKVVFSPTITSVGAGISTYSWSASASAFGCAGASSSTYSCTPTTAGTFTVSLTVSDANGLTASASSAGYTVAASPPLQVSASANPTSPNQGQAVTFTAQVSGGSGPYVYFWSFGDGVASSLASPSHAYSSSGTFTATVIVNDTAGHSVATSVVVDVQGGGGSSGSGLLSSVGGVPLWALLVVLLLVVAVVATLVLTRKKRAPPADATPAAAEWEGSYAPVAMAGPPGAIGAVSQGPPAESYAAPPTPVAVAPPAPAETPVVMAPPASAPPPVAPSAPPAKRPAPTDRPIDEVAPDPFGGRPPR